MQKKDNLKPLLVAVMNTRNNLSVDPKPLVFIKLAPDLTYQEKKDIANVVKDSKVSLKL